MNDQNKHAQPFIMVLGVAVVLLIVSQFNTKKTLFGYETKPVEPFSDILTATTVQPDSIEQLAVADSIVKDSLLAIAPATPPNFPDIIDFKTDSGSALAHFFESLNATKKQKNKTRIAYFGDSMIEGDLISQDLRSLMQDTFGGNGVGFVPITSIVAGFRGTVIHSFGNWETYHLLKNPPANHVLGISGYSFVTNVVNTDDTTGTAPGESWVKYYTVNKSHIDRFYEAKLLYGKSEEGNIAVINGGRYALKGTNVVNEVSITNSGGMHAINAAFQCKTPVDIFGFSMESDSGVFVDNFSFRGNSGMPITKVYQSVYSGTNKYLDYDLIILEYGLNAVNSKVTDFSWYERGMENVIKHMQAAFPEASILLISVGDKSYRHNGVYETDPSVPILVDAQKKLAKNNKLAFWSLYDAMGGNGSMVQWVEGDTVYANKDYTHFNFKGAHRAGKMLYTQLLNEYVSYNNRMQKATASSLVTK